MLHFPTVLHTVVYHAHPPLKGGDEKAKITTMLVLPGGYAFHKFSQNVTSFHKFSQHENRYKIVKAGEKW